MTNAIETTKCEMWSAIANAKGRIEINYSIKDMMRGVEQFEGLLEDHLEQLRQQYEQMAAKARERFESIQSLEQSGQDLTARLLAMTEERDTIRNKLQAFEFANKSSGKFLIDALRKVKSQRKTIKALRNAQEARESVGATSVSGDAEFGHNATIEWSKLTDEEARSSIDEKSRKIRSLLDEIEALESAK